MDLLSLLIIDTIPNGASYVSGGTRVGNEVSWNVGSLAAGATTQVSFIVTAMDTITNSSYRVSAAGGASATGTVPVVTQVYPPVATSFSASPLADTVPLTITFTNSSTGANSYPWDFGDGITSTEINPTHTYTQAGVYTVSLRASNPVSNQTLTRTNYISAYEPIVIDFLASPLTGTFPLTVTFVNSTTGATSYLWDFGDTGVTSTEVNPTHPYTQAGTYTVTLTATGLSGSQTSTRPNYVTVYEPVMAAFEATPVMGTVPLTVTFSNSSTGASAYLWDFGDGITDTVINPTHTYTQAGVYTVTLTANGPGGNATLTQTNSITALANLALSKSAPSLVTGDAPITYTLTVTNPDSLTATNLVITDIIPAGATYITGGVRIGEVVSWTVPSLVGGEAISVTFSVTATGTISNSIYGVSADNGLAAIGQAAIETTVLDFTADPLTGTVPLTVTLTNLATPTQVITDFVWSYGDGLTQTTSTLSHTHSYTQAGVYTVSLTALGVDGSSTPLTRTNYLTVEPQRVALIPVGAEWRYLTGTVAPPADWPTLNFEASTWAVGPSGLGFGYDASAHPTELADMSGNYVTVFTRKVFTLEHPADLAALYLDLDYDDGFIAYLNGTPVVTENVTSAAYTATATVAHPASSGHPDRYDLSAYLDQLQPGQNVLAVQGHNVSLTDSGFLLIPALGAQPGELTPHALFSATPLTGTVPLTVTFINRSPHATHFLWDFGDGITQTETISAALVYPSSLTTTHLYTQAGVYTVTLAASDGQLSDTLAYTDYISVIEPTAAITPPGKLWWDDDFFYRRPITLNTTSLVTYDSAITKVAKLTLDTTTLLSDGKLRPDGKDVRVAYWDGLAWSELARTVQNPGTVTTTVLFPLQATLTDTVVSAYWLYYGNAVPNPAPLLMEDYGQAAEPYMPSGEEEAQTGIHTDFLAEPVAGLAPLEVTLTNLSFPEPQGYAWDFGDGNTDTQTDTVHLYETPGVYTITLRAMTNSLTSALAWPGLIWVAGLDVSDQVTANLGSLEETPVVSATVTASVTETQVMTSAESTLSVAFPPGATSQDLIITHTPYRAIVKQGSGLLTRFDLTAQTADGQPVTHFNQPLTFTLDLKRFNLTDELARTCIFLTWDETEQSWEPISTTIDINQHLLYGQVNHFSVFAAVASGEPGGPPSLGAALPTTVADTASGAATFAIPVEVPPGTAGMQPVVSIGYSSLQAQLEMNPDSGEVPGLLGIGTFLNVSYIGRSSQEADRAKSPLAADDYFLVMNGRKQQLIPESNSEGGIAYLYRTTDETFWRIERIGAMDTNSCANSDNEVEADCAYWQVTTKDGTIYTFGQTPDSIQRALTIGLAEGAELRHKLYSYPGRFYLNRVQDVNGNYMVFEYDKLSQSYPFYLDGENIDTANYDQAVYLTSIDYTANDAVSPALPSQRKVEFGYTERAITDTTDFLGANPFSGSQSFYYDRRLQAIATTVDSSLVRRYVFDYDYLTRIGIFDLNQIHYLTLKGVSIQGNDGSTFNLGTRLDYYEQWEQAATSNRFGLLKQVDTQHSGATFNKIEYDYAEQTLPFDKILDRILGTVRPWWLVSRQTQSVNEADPEAEPQTLTYHYDEVTGGPGQGPVVQISADGAVTHYGAFPDDYRRVAMHDDLTGRTTIQAFYIESEAQTKNPLAGRLAWTEVFTDPDEACAEKYTGVANFLCSQASYLTGQYLAYQQAETASNGDDQAIFVAPESVIQAIGPLDSGAPQDWTQTRYEYDANGNVSMLVELNDPANDSDGRATVMDYYPTAAEEAAHILNRLKSVDLYPTAADAESGRETADLSRVLSCTRFTYDPAEAAVPTTLTQETYRPGSNNSCAPLNAPILDLQSMTTFDAFGNVTASQGAAGNYQVEYDPTYFTFPITTTYPVGNGNEDLITTASYDPGFGLATQTVAMNEAVTKYGYDAFGRIISATNQAIEGNNTLYDYLYDDTGLTLTITQADGLDELTTAQRYNGLGQLQWSASEGENGQTIQTDYQYNQGRLWQESVPHYADVPLSSRLWTIYEYDDLDRPIRVTHPDGAIQQTQYTGWSQQRVIDENEHVIDYTRDALGRVLQVIAYTGTLSSPAPYATTVYTYNARGQATEVRDQAGNLTQMGYDSVGRVLQLDDPDQGEWTYQYSINGPLTQQISPREIILKFDYDLQNRLTLVRREILETGSETYAEFTYDNADSNGQGQRTSMTDASGYTTYTYDAAGRLITETREIDGIIYRTGFSYDPLNRVKSLTYPDPSSSSGQGGEVITYTYNNQGLLEGLTTLTGDLSITDLDYNALGQTTRLTGANGLNWQFGYHPTHLALEQATLAVGETSLAFGYEYDDAGMLERVYDNGGAISMDLTYTYDPLNRLQSVSGSAGGFNLARTYTYDPVGNLMSKDGLSYTYANPAGFPAHAPSQVGDFNFSYDATGNRSQRSQGSLEVGYRYDELNRLAYVISDTAVISGVEGIESVTQAVYDGDGQRIKRITAVGTTVTLGQHYEVFYPASLNQTAPLTNSDCLYPMSHNAPRLVVDSQGGRRLIYQAEQGLCGASLNAAGQVIEAGGSNGSAENGYTFFDLDRDDQDAVHYLWQDSFNGQPYLRVSGATVVSGTVVSAAALAVEGSTGLAHVVWADTGGSLTYAQAADNTVQANQTLASSGAAGPRVALDASNLAHVIWRQAEPDRYAILYRAIGGANETVSTENCPANEASAPVVAVDGEGQVYAAWVGSDSYDPSRSEPICYAVRAPGGGWTVSQLDRTSPSRHLELQVSDDGQTVYLLRGARAFLADELESKGDYSQETLYLERYQDGVWTTALVNTYPSQDGDQDSFTNSVLDGDLDIDAQGNAYVAWLDNGPTWEEEETLRLRTTQILSTTVPQITKHYYAAEQRIASRVDDDLYYTLSDPTGHATLFADSTGQAVGQILYDSFGGVVTSTLPTTLTTRLAGHLDSTGLLYDGQRYFDPMVGNYLQPSLVGGLPEGPQGLNRYNVGSGSYPAYLSSPRGNGGISPLIADAGESFLSNSTSAWIGNRLEPIPGRLAAATVGDWHWLRVQTYAFASGRYRAGSLAEFFQHQWFGPFKYHRFSQDAFGNGLHEALVRRLPDEADSLARSLSRSGASINWEPVFGSTAGRIWNSSFGLARNPRLAGLAEHFTVGKFSLGVVADIAVGGIVQGVKDYDLWSTDPWLATRRVGAAGGANATVGLLAGGATAGVFAGLVWAGVISTPPGWVIASTTIGTAVILDITIGDTIKEKWFWAFDADSP